MTNNIIKYFSHKILSNWLTENKFDIPLEASFFSPLIQLGNASAWKIIWKHELPGENKNFHHNTTTKTKLISEQTKLISEQTKRRNCKRYFIDNPINCKSLTFLQILGSQLQPQMTDLKKSKVVLVKKVIWFYQYFEGCKSNS